MAGAYTGMITGRDANLRVNGTILKVRKFTANVSNAVVKAAHSMSAGWKETAKGTNDWTLSFELILDGGKMNVLPSGVNMGELVTLDGRTDSVPTGSFVGSGRIKSIGEPVEIEGQALVATVECEGHGPPTVDGVALT